jgi:predicted transcriptional regulator
MTDAEEFDGSADSIDDEDDETLAAIAEGIRDAEAGRTIPIEKVRKLLRERASPKF